jgi:hypothetical protein
VVRILESEIRRDLARCIGRIENALAAMPRCSNRA